MCGLKLYESVDENLFAGLISAIKEVQDEGKLVKLSFGGAKYGNLKVFTKVVHQYYAPGSIKELYSFLLRQLMSPTES